MAMADFLWPKGGHDRTPSPKYATADEYSLELCITIIIIDAHKSLVPAGVCHSHRAIQHYMTADSTKLVLPCWCFLRLIVCSTGLAVLILDSVLWTGGGGGGGPPLNKICKIW